MKTTPLDYRRSHNRVSIGRMKSWALEHLPRLNAKALTGDLSYRRMAIVLNEALLSRTPRVATLSDEEALQMLVILGIIGSSVERHAQQQFIKQESTGEGADFSHRGAMSTPGKGLAALYVNQTIPFLSYFQHVADIVGHPHRDSVMTLNDFNGPGVEVRHPITGQSIYTLPALFNDGRFLTYSDNVSEVNFYGLIKQTLALQIVANQYIEYLQQPTTALDSREAIEAILTATYLIWAVKAKIIDFMNHKTFEIDFFLDIFRQYACQWYADRYLKPPSGANDAAALLRDVMLFDNLVPPIDGFPGFRGHVQEVCTVLLPEHRKQLNTAMGLDSVEARIFNRLGISKADFAELAGPSLSAIVQDSPWLLAYLQLYNAQRDMSRVHYALVLKYILRPKQSRDAKDDPREYITIVNNARGTTGMEPIGIMVRLDEARYHHPLHGLNRQAAVKQLAEIYLGRIGLRQYSHNELLTLSNLIQRSGPGSHTPDGTVATRYTSIPTAEASPSSCATPICRR
jgi:hypothetical protein